MRPLRVAALACLTWLAACSHDGDGQGNPDLAESADLGAGISFDLTTSDDGGGLLTSGALIISPATLDFGRVPSGRSSSLSIGLVNGGAEPITVSALAVSGAPFSVDTSALPLQLAVGGTATVSVSFAPTMNGHYNGTLTVTSSAASTPATVMLVAKSGYQVDLKWNAPVTPDGGDPAVSYNVYRGTMSGGPYTKLNTAPVTTTSYTDFTVQDCMTYYYVTTSVDAMGKESTYSNESVSVIPCP